MKFTVQKLDQVSVAAVEGRVDGVTSVEIQKKLLAILQEEHKPLIIDFKNVEYLSSAGMRTLLLVSKRSKELSNIVCLINLSPQIEDVLEMTGFLSFLKTYKDLDTAIAQVTK